MAFSRIARRQKTTRTVGRQYRPFMVMLLVSSVLFGAIATRLYYLQLVQSEQWQQRAEDNRIRIIPKQPIRGNIFDRKGKVLATTRLSHSLYLWPRLQKQSDWPEIRALLADITKIPEAEIQQKVEAAGYNSSTLIRIARNLDFAQVTAIEEYRSMLEGVEVDVESVRHYPHGSVAAHILGYTGELNAEELAERRKDGYRLGDVVGKMGIEEGFEPRLRGEWGGLQLEVDGAGRAVRLLGQKQAKPGQDLQTHIDLEVQKAAEEALGDRKGAIVVLDVKTGGVIAMTSYPSFDPNIFTGRITPEIWQKLQGNGNPFVNRAIRGFPPASTFKVVTATAGMETGKFPHNVVLPTFAYLHVGGTAFGEWNRAGFGPMGYVAAMAWSSNTFHGQVGRGVGGKNLIDWARRYGYGQKTGIELSEEYAGLIADDAWKQENYGWAWSQGDTVNMSIGQGFTLATPLQVARMFAAVANDGYIVRPHFLKSDDGAALEQRTNLNLKPTTISTLRQGLRTVVSGGTGGVLNVPHLPPVAGKSGTAEAPPGEVHTWFGAYAPYDKPEIAIVAFAEHSGGGGGSVAAPMVKQVLEAYFGSQESEVR